MPASRSPDDSVPALQVDDLLLRYESGRQWVDIVDVARLSIPAGAHVGITGPSGSGKTSLLHLVTGVERATRGRVAWGGTDVAALGEGAGDAWRRRHVGFVFQNFHLVPHLTALENVLLPWRFDHWRLPPGESDRAVAELLALGIAEPHRRAAVLSRGEQQRVAIARALARRPPILAADEPTASLDADNGALIGDLLLNAAGRAGATLLVVTHDDALLARLGIVLRMAAGRLAADRAAA